MVSADPLGVLADLEARGVRVAVVGGRLRTLGDVTPDLAVTLRRDRDLIVAVVVGRATGHVLAPCTVCREGTLTAALDPKGKPRRTWPSCRMTPRCPGRHQPDPAELGHVAPVPPPAQAAPPAPPARQHLLGPRQPWPEQTYTAPPRRAS